MFEPTRAAGLARLDAFVARAGRDYTDGRNFDHGAGQHRAVSTLSPWIKHRLITEEEVIAATLAQHDMGAAMPFIQEVFWRGYFKGWLEQHPSVWLQYQTGLRVQVGDDYADAIAGRTGIACFDHWRDELVATGYLHNHARMWFASIWIFTLRLPWALGAAFFMQHLVDGDAAANTLSWRWVGGLHTKGKTYLAQADNIARFTGGRFNPAGLLATHAEALSEPMEHPLVPLARPDRMPQGDHLRLVTPEDCTFASGAGATLGLVPVPPVDQAQAVSDFTKAAVPDARVSDDWARDIVASAQAAGVTDVVTAWAPVGAVAGLLDAAMPDLVRAGLTLNRVQRDYDTVVWPHAGKGFFKLKKKIPQVLSELGLVSA